MNYFDFIKNMSQSTKMQLQCPYLKRHVTAPKISRLKLQDEFASRGWNACLSPFETNLDESECDITASPTKYPFFKRTNIHETCSKKKPMLLEISNIESVFLQNKQKISKSSDTRKQLSETFYDFVPKLTKQEKLNIICHRKRAQNFHESSILSKKVCKESSKNKKNDNFFIANSSFIKENSPKKESFTEVNACKKASDFLVQKESSDTSNVKNDNSQKITKEIFIKQDTLLKVPNTSLSSFSLKSNRDEILRVENNIYNKILNSDSCNRNFYTKDFHLKSNIPSSPIPDTSFIDKCQSDKKMNSKICLDTLKNDFLNQESSPSVTSNSPVSIHDESSPEFHVSPIVQNSPVHSKPCNFNKNSMSISDSGKISTTTISNSPISIHDESSPEPPVSPVLPCSPALFQPCEVDKNEQTISVRRKNKFNSELLKLQDLQESFQVKKYEESLIFDCSPIKTESNKQDVNVNITNKCKEISEIFTVIKADAKFGNNVLSDEAIQKDYCPVNIEQEKDLSMPEASLKNETVNSGNECEISKAKRMSVDNKIFMRTIQSSFQEKTSTGDKGSNWVQTLNWDNFSQSTDTKSEQNDQIGKKNSKSIIHGGFAEQMFKLQRRERCDRVIWNHKMNELKKKAAASSITFTLTSVLHHGQIVMTKSTTSDIDNEYLKGFLCNSNDGRITHNNSLYDELLPELLPFIVCFQREIYTKMHLKVGDEFFLYPPWQCLSVPSLPCPVILCTYYLEAINKDEESVQKEPSEVHFFPILYKSLQEKSCECDEPVLSNKYLCNSSDLYGKSVCVSARVQRIWEAAVVNRCQSILKIYDHSFFVLLETQDGVFLELKINSSQLPDAYLKLLTYAEGKCLKFCDVVISHRYNLKKTHELKSFLQYIQNHSNGGKKFFMQQSYCYQFIPTSLNKIPSDIPEETFPLYYDYIVQPLSFLQKNNHKDMRFSCIGKIFCQDKEDFYITDESLLCSKVKKYYLIKFKNILNAMKESLVGATVLIKEAISDESYLLIDKFSSCEILSNSEADKFRHSYESRMKKICLITYEHVVSPLNLSSKVKDLVLVKGVISKVDENTAVSWLECSFCSGENLLEDSHSVIYCEDCARIVPKPILKVKMEVIVQDTCLSPAKMKIQLLSSTIKRILKISEDNYQPECNISDVLKKNTGVLCCYLRDIEIVDEMKIFYLTEVKNC